MRRLWVLPVVLAAALGCARVERRENPGIQPVLESRGVWLEKAEMIEGKEALAARLDRLQEAGFNSVYVAMQVRGCVMYPGSAVLPLWEGAATAESDLISWLVEEIHRRGMKAEAWTEFGFYTYHTPDATKDPSRGAVLAMNPGLVARDSEGKNYLHNEQWGDFYSLCPSNPKSQEVLSNLYLEMMERFGFDGLNLDRIRYPTDDFCYCSYCREHFERDTGIQLSKFAANSAEQKAFEQWRKDNLTSFMACLSRKLRSRIPGVRITSAVVPPETIDEKGQDWLTWIRKGYLDAAMPMLYSHDIRESVAMIKDRVGEKARIFYGLDAGQGIDVLNAQIDYLRRSGAHGVTIWYSKSVDPLLPELKEQFATAALSPLYAERRRAD